MLGIYSEAIYHIAEAGWIYIIGSCTLQGESEEREPWVYLKCGHLHGYHEWKAGPKESDSRRTCPVCREVRTLNKH